MDGDLDRSTGPRVADQLATPTQLHVGARAGGDGDAVEEVGAGQGGNEGAGRSAKELLRRRDLHHPALIDDRDPLSERDGILEGVGDQQGGKGELGEDAGELLADLPAGDGVERTERLIEQQHARIAGECAGEGDPLALAARELAWLGAGEMLEAEAPEQVRTVSLAGESHIARHRQVGKEPVILGEVADPAPARGQINPAAGIEPRLAAQRDPSGLWTLQTGDGPQQRRLSGTGGADQRDRLGRDVQRDAEIERPPGQRDVGSEEGFHQWISSLEESRITALRRISSTPIATAWSRLASNSE